MNKRSFGWVCFVFNFSDFLSERLVIGMQKYFLRQAASACLIVLALLCIRHASQAQDTIPPQILTPARDSSMACSNSPLILTALTNWYNAAGYATAQDDSGQFTWEADKTLAQVLSIFAASSDTLCGNTRNVQVTFTAKDPSGNRSQPTSARFFTFDNTRPTLVVPANVTVSCTPSIRDSLIRWIRNKAGYQANDDCSNILTWTRFQYSISQGNTIIQTGGGNIQNGPYPTIPNGVCLWRMNINFWVADECGNETVTFGTTSFTVMDNVAPMVVNPPLDVTVSCENIPDVPQVAFLDGCTQSPSITFTQTSDQDPDTLICSHFRYMITRTWQATDACGNSSSYRQNIRVTDTIPPIVEAHEYVTISCSEFSPDSLYYSEIRENCSSAYDFSIEKEIQPASCRYSARFKYITKDICLNTDTFEQFFTIVADSIEWVRQPEDEIYFCNQTENFQVLFTDWINRKADSEARASCGDVLFFAAVPGSYDPSDSATWPGIHPASLDPQTCPSPLHGFLRAEPVDFVYYNTCGQILMDRAVFGIRDTLSPGIIQCPQNLSLELPENECFATVVLPVPDVTDDCTEATSPVMRTVSAPVISVDPTNADSPVHPIALRIGPLSPTSVIPLSDASVMIRFRRLDMDDATEFFNVLDEDNNFVARSPATLSECGDTEMNITLPLLRLTDWISDGFITLHFVPNSVPGIPRAEINGFCGGSIQTTITFDIDLRQSIIVQYTLNGGDFVSVSPSDTLYVNMNPGSHDVRFFYEDCAGNVEICTTSIEIRDVISPNMICPDSKIIPLAAGECIGNVRFDLREVITLDACEGNYIYDQKVPVSNEASLITFLYNNVTGRHVARNKQFLFNNVIPVIRKESVVRLTLEFEGNNEGDESYFEILAPDGSAIGSSFTRNSADSCGFTTTTFEIPQDRFNSWVFNKQVSFTAVPNNTGNGINPCVPIDSSQTTDGISRLRLRLRYDDYAYAYQLQGAVTTPLINISQDSLFLNLELIAGKTTVDLVTSDASGNKGNCRFDIILKDTTSPQVRCKNASVNIHPSGIVPTILDAAWFDNGSQDACGAVTFMTNPSSVDCNQANTDVLIWLIGTDEQGNKDSCTALLRVKPFELMPGFSSGLCENDTLKLFANVPESPTPGTYTFHWKGPNNFEFFTENPEIPNVSEIYNGLYTLTVTGFNQCKTEGSVFVNIQPLTKPVLQSSESSLCEGASVVLSTTLFTGNITYDWYEGIAPTGVKIGTTQVPDFILQPLPGIHFYYVIARGENCSSSPSNLLKVTVIGRPAAMIEQLFYSLCEGETLTLRSTNTGNDLMYNWSGPGFTSNLKNPSPIPSVTTANQGQYFLQVSKEGCISDTARTVVIILERPVKPVISAANVFCQGATFSLLIQNINNGDRYEWYQNGLLRFTTTENNLLIPNIQPNFQGGWHVIVFKGSCASQPSDVISVAIDNLLEIGATNSGPICEGDSVMLQATFVPNALYKWESPDPMQVVPKTHNPKIPARSGYYSVTITTPTGCENNTGTFVEIITPPVITAVSTDAERCVDGTKPITFSPSVFPTGNQYTYTWISSSGFFSQEINAKILQPTIQDTGLYTLIVSVNGCPSKPFTVPLQFFKTPLQPEILGDPFYCSGDSIRLSSSVILTSPDSKYLWTTPAFGQFSLTSSSFNAGAASGILQGFYTLILEVSGCRSRPSIPYSLSVRPKPVIPAILSNSPVCFGEKIMLEAGFADVMYLWTGPDNFSSDLSMFTIPDVEEKNEGWYYLRVEKEGCLSDNSDSLFVTVEPALRTPIISGERYFLCNDAASAIEICLDPNSILPGDTIILFNNTNSSVLATIIAPCFNLTGPVTGLAPGPNFLYTYTKNKSCISPPSNVIILEYDDIPSFSAGILQNDTIRVCEGATVDLTSNHGPPDVDINWSAFRPEIIFNHPDRQTTMLTGLLTGENQILLAYSYRGCRFFTTDTIRIFVEAFPAAENDFYTLSYNAGTGLAVLDNDRITGETLIKIKSNPSSGMVMVKEDKIVYQPDVRFTGSTRFSYEICSVFCPSFCSEAFVDILVETEKDCRPPNIFTPNEDGINDFFIVPCLYSNSFPGNRLVIYNEWGNEVFSARDYGNDWRGIYNGSPLPGGTYFYVLDLGNGNKPLNGFLILQR